MYEVFLILVIINKSDSHMPPSDGYVFVVFIIAKSDKKRKSCVIE